MSTTPKPIPDAAAKDHAKGYEMADKFAGLYAKSVERLAEIEKRTLDLALQHNQDTMEIWKQATDKLPWMPRLNLFAEAAVTLERIADFQKTAIDLAVDQTRAFVEIMKERSAGVSKSTDSAVNFAHRSFERTVAAQKKAAEVTVAGAKSAFDKAFGQFGPGGEAVADSIQRGVDTVAEAQKELLETLTR